MLTNLILKNFSADIDESLFEKDTESDEAQKFNEKIEIAARQDFVEMLSSDNVKNIFTIYLTTKKKTCSY